MALTDKLTAIADAIRAQSGKTAKIPLSQMPNEILGIQPLNFEVVGNPKPQNPKANTIWVDTDAMTGWVFSPNKPQSPSEGLVWFNYSSSGSATFNALKSNSIEISPNNASQYSNGEWKSIAVQTYMGNKWVGWAMALVANGRFVAEMGESKYYGTYNNLYTTVTPLDNGGVKIEGAGGSGIIAHTFEKAFNVTDFSKMRVKTGTVVSSYVNVGLSAINSDISIAFTKAVQKTLASNSDIVIDISALTGEYYLVFGFDYHQTTKSAELLEITLE